MRCLRRFAGVLLATVTLTASRAGGADPDGTSNLASQKLLPSGPGLAAGLPADAGLSAHADVIFADAFEKGALGEGWDEVGNKGGKIPSMVEPEAGAPSGLGRRCLRVEAHLGQDTGGGLTKWFA